MKVKITMILVILCLSLGFVFFGSLNPVMAGKSGLFENVNLVCTTNPVVTNDGGSGGGALRQAVIDACAGSTITFANNVTGTILLQDGQITIDKNLTIQGPGANLLTVKNIAPQSSTSRVFLVNAGVTATIAGLTITGGNVPGNGGGGGGIFNNGTLTVTNSTISNNSSGVNSFGNGGGIYKIGTLTVTNSTISNNSSDSGGGIYNSFGLTLNVANSTVESNAAHNGGGIYNSGILNVAY